jgi:hypothetical protein
LFSQSAQSQAASPLCTPVVYGFRHAEDVNGPPTALTPIGTEHANLYIEMITSLEVTQNYCPVAAVYAVNPIKPDRSVGTTNPYFTARPLANIVMNKEPIVEVEGHPIGEFLENGEAALLLSAIKNDLTNHTSVALFWTSQGISTLAKVLNVDSDIPAGPNPPRNAAYVFQWVETSLSLTPWTPTSVPHYVQCFKVKPLSLPDPSKPAAVPAFSSYKYYCGIGYNAQNYNPSLGGAPSEPYPVGNKILDKYLYKLQGRICDLANLDTSEPITGYYGFCISGSKPPAF